MQARTVEAHVAWDGYGKHHQALAPGYYTVRMRAIALDDANVARIGTGLPREALNLAATTYWWAAYRRR